MPFKMRDIIEEAAAKVFAKEFSTPPIHPGNIKWTWHRVNPDDPDSAQVDRFEASFDQAALKEVNRMMSNPLAEWGRAKGAELGLTGPIAPEPREVPGSEYARAPAQHQWGPDHDRCERCGLVRELVEDFAPDCGDPVDVRDAVIAAMCRALARATVVVRGGESPSVIEDMRREVASLTDQLQGMNITLQNASDSYLESRRNERDTARVLQRMTESYELSCVARDQLRSENRLLKEENARLKTELDRHPWARRIK